MKIIFKSALGRDVLVPGRVVRQLHTPKCFFPAPGSFLQHDASNWSHPPAAYSGFRRHIALADFMIVSMWFFCLRLGLHSQNQSISKLHGKRKMIESRKQENVHLRHWIYCILPFFNLACHPFDPLSLFIFFPIGQGARWWSLRSKKWVWISVGKWD